MNSTLKPNPHRCEENGTWQSSLKIGKQQLLAKILSLSAIFGAFENLRASNYQEYIIDTKPFASNPSIEKDYQELGNKIWNGTIDYELFKRRLELVESVLQHHPNWVDGMWMVAADTFQMASLITDPKQVPLARQLLLKGQKHSERCLAMAPHNPLCKTFLATSIAKRGEIEGVLASLDYAEQVEDLWVQVTKSNMNFQFTSQISMQGAVRYALGIFYRLVPDYAILDWIYGVRGNIEKSIAFHQESLRIDSPELPCSHMMLGVSLICSAEANPSEKAFELGMHHLKQASGTMSITSVNSAVCIKDAARLQTMPQDACSYSVAGQQAKGDEEYFKNQKEQMSQNPISH